MAFEAFKHPKVKKVYFIPRKNPVEVIDDERDYTIAQAANLLGIDRATVKGLIADGRLDADEDGKIAGDSLAELAAELEPVELDLVEVDVNKGEEEESEPAPKAKSATAKAATEATPAKTKRVVQLAEDEPESEPETWSAECPSCGEQFDVAGDILRLKCPGCNEVLTVSDAAPTKPAVANPRRKRFLGIV